MGFRILKIERKLIQQFRSFQIHEERSSKKSHCESGNIGETWIGLNPQILLTPYSELYDIFNLISDHPVHSVVDIGCAYGRVGVVSKAFFPQATFYGYEIVKKRLSEADRISNLHELEFQLSAQNVLDNDFELPKCSVYFIYDFSHFMHIKNILQKLDEYIGVHPFILVAKGDEVRSNIQMYFPKFYMDKTPIYRKEWSIFFLN